MTYYNNGARKLSGYLCNVCFAVRDTILSDVFTYVENFEFQRYEKTRLICDETLKWETWDETFLSNFTAVVAYCFLWPRISLCVATYVHRHDETDTWKRILAMSRCLIFVVARSSRYLCKRYSKRECKIRLWYRKWACNVTCVFRSISSHRLRWKKRHCFLL